MKCASCEKEVTSGFFKETEEGMMCLCTDCLRMYDQYRKLVQKHRNLDCEGIYQMHQKGYGNKTIATFFGTNPFVVSRIIKEIETSDRFNL